MQDDPPGYEINHWDGKQIGDDARLGLGVGGGGMERSYSGTAGIPRVLDRSTIFTWVMASVTCIQRSELIKLYNLCVVHFMLIMHQ